MKRNKMVLNEENQNTRTARTFSPGAAIFDKVNTGQVYIMQSIYNATLRVHRNGQCYK